MDEPDEPDYPEDDVDDDFHDCESVDEVQEEQEEEKIPVKSKRLPKDLRMSFLSNKIGEMIALSAFSISNVNLNLKYV